MTEPKKGSSRYWWLLAPLLLGAGLVFLMWRDPVAPSRPLVPDLGELPTSAVSIPFLYSPDALVQELERQVPVVVGGLSSRESYPPDPRFQYAFEARRSPFEVEFRGDTVRVDTTVRYGGQVWFRTPIGPELSAGCGVSGEATAADAPRARVTFRSPIQIDEGWNVRSNLQVERVEPLTAEDRCVVSVLQLRLDATEPIMSGVQRWLRVEAERIDAALAAVPMRTLIEQSWEAILEPIPLAPEVWLTLNPSGIGYRFAGSEEEVGGLVRGMIDVALRPTVVTGAAPETLELPLPPLGSAPSESDSWVIVEGRAGYEMLSDVTAATLVGRSFRVAGRTAEVHSFVITGSEDGRVSGVLDIGGGFEARVLLTGTPIFDPLVGELAFPDLVVSIESDDILARVAGWLLSGKLSKRARALAKIRVNDALTQQLGSSRELNIRLAGGGLETRLDALQVTSVAARPDELVVRSRIRPEMTLRLP